MEITDDVLRKYFEAAVAYRLASLSGSLDALRARTELSVEAVDSAINALEDARRRLADLVSGG